MSYLENKFLEPVTKTKKPNNSRKILINPEIFMTLDLHKNNGAKHSQTQDICKILV
jgi:hypothetical protein